MQIHFHRYGIRIRVFLLLGFVGFVFIFLPTSKAAGGQSKQHIAQPPVAPVKPVTTDYYGTKVVDPYRYMENLKDPKVQAWMKAQNAYTRAVLARIPGREKLLARIRQLDQTVPQVQATRLPGDRYLILKQLPGDNAAKLYLRQGLDGKDKLLVDPEKVRLARADRGRGANVISYFAASQDGKYVAVTITPGGAEMNSEVHVFETASGRETGDVILRAWGGEPEWLPGDRSFVYGRLRRLPPGTSATEIEEKIRSYLHVLGRDAGKDPAVFGYGVVPSIHVDPRLLASVEVPPGSSYAVGAINSGVSANYALYIEPVAQLGRSNSSWHRIANLSDDVGATPSPTSDALATAFCVHGSDLYLLTYKNAPRYKVIRTSARHPDLATAETIVSPSQAVVTGIHGARDALYVELLGGGINRVMRVPYGPKPKVEEVALPFKGTVDVRTDPRLPGALLGIKTWTKAYRIYSYDPETKRVTDTGLQPVGPFGAPTNIESEEVKVRSYDGTLVPLSIVRPRRMKMDGSNPTLLFGYGAYGITQTPTLNPVLLAWYEKGGVFAICHARGGGAFGEAWHLAGKGPTKPNTWRDFIACAQYLIEHKYTSPAHLAGFGASAGGITIGRAITTRPDLFGAAVDWAGLSDTLRFETTSNGEVNISEFGSVKTKAGFRALYAMSTYAHVKKGTAYPAVLLMTGINDPRVNPWEMDKMAARLRAATSSGKPVLLRVNYAGGHAFIDATKTQTEDSFADIFSFLLWQFGAPGFQPSKNTLVVLPFKNLSGDTKQQYFSDGFTAELTDMLGHNPALRVIAWDTASKYRNPSESDSAIGKALNVSSVLQGSIQREGNRVRISAELVNAVTGHELWSQHYDESFAHIFNVEDQVSKAIAQVLQVKFSAFDLPAGGTKNPEAHELVLKGSALMGKLDAASYGAARKDFEQALALDPEYADAHALLGGVQLVVTYYSGLPLKAALPAIRAHLQKALALDPHNIAAILALGDMAAMVNPPNFAKARAEYRKALALDPSNATAHMDYALVLPLKRAVEETQEAIRLDPDGFGAWINLAGEAQDLGDWAQEVTAAETLMRLAPKYVGSAFCLVFAYQQLQEYGKMVAAFDRVEPASDVDRQQVAAGKLVYQALGNSVLRPQALAALKKLSGHPPNPLVSGNLVQMYLALGETAPALQVLENYCPAYPAGCNDLAINPIYRALHSDPRFERLAKKYTTVTLE